MPRRKKNPTLADEVAALSKQLSALVERVREAEAVKNAIDAHLAAVRKKPSVASAGAPSGNGRRRRRRTTTAGAAPKPAPANRRRRRRKRRAAPAL